MSDQALAEDDVVDLLLMVEDEPRHDAGEDGRRRQLHVTGGLQAVEDALEVRVNVDRGQALVARLVDASKTKEEVPAVGTAVLNDMVLALGLLRRCLGLLRCGGTAAAPFLLRSLAALGKLLRLLGLGFYRLGRLCGRLYRLGVVGRLRASSRDGSDATSVCGSFSLRAGSPPPLCTWCTSPAIPPGSTTLVFFLFAIFKSSFFVARSLDRSFLIVPRPYKSITCLYLLLSATMTLLTHNQPWK